MPSSQDLQFQIDALERKLATTPEKHQDGTWNKKRFALANKIKTKREKLKAIKNFEHLAR